MAKKHTVTILEGEKEIPANFWIEPYGFVTRTGLQPQREYRWDQLLEFSIEGPEQLQKRVTVTRLLAIGIFAFAKKKASGESFLFARLESKEVLNLIRSQSPMFSLSLLRIEISYQVTLHLQVLPWMTWQIKLQNLQTYMLKAR